MIPSQIAAVITGNADLALSEVAYLSVGQNTMNPIINVHTLYKYTFINAPIVF